MQIWEGGNYQYNPYSSKMVKNQTITGAKNALELHKRTNLWNEQCR